MWKARLQKVQPTKVTGILLDDGPKGGTKLLIFRIGVMSERIVRMTPSARILDDRGSRKEE